MSDLQAIIEKAWDERDGINSSTAGEVRRAVLETIEAIDAGTLRVAEKNPDHPEAEHGWVVNQWAKKAVLLYFKLHDNQVMGDEGATYFDKVPLKFAGWDEARFKQAGFRAVPPATARKGVYIAPGVVLMPSYCNIGAYVDSGTMVDTWATVGSCAQIGKNVHISGGAGIGGVLEPLQANPVIIEDNCFIGARAEVAEGVIVGEGSVLSMGVYLGKSTKIVDRASGEIHMGYVPPYSVVVSGTMPGKPMPNGQPGPNLYCAVIVKTVDAQTRSKTGINELLREF
ncbi:2,3,4,5-tetrahydropyridine-2,6-dicarboxylate N-succinyltransferase [Magnetococcus marinus MC-1]|uniref:2,3,4,5-tetrahydropyridine-2,6-dicarboxylate N-succinyltransferase n=1 Tax=Magnetococcus marinus (strain ATCC BAA-1437 / JCM 17883 / MC-1) TaxID=156889 RepID=A0L3N1_MAGMM|nr:2,3,4,5-tetrahydropyridine-2,6-dicarboxylate N-succinyltransferase [Magnetococcus marinus]ABK42574.1 2,3,4,5-tetrahydropyridine-2,6-dicarboxylate N-succinyltransferase [Magnetococcus marinus MC-1]